MTVPSPNAALARGALPMMATAAGVTVANVYLCQPLLSAMAHDFHISSATAGWVATAAQVGYALGILLIVPLGDRADSKRLVRILMACACAALVAAACAPTVYLLIAATLALTMATVVPQILIPLTVSNAAPERAGRVVGAMQSGLILGILLSRTVSGTVGQYTGSWRNSYFLAAALTAVLFFALPRFMPEKRAAANATPMPYLQLLASLPTLLVRWNGLRLSAVLGACVFGAFSAFWATLAFHLAQPPFGYGSAQAGLFGLWGAAGALIAPFCGRLSDKYGPALLNTIAIGATLLAFAAFLGGGDVSVFAIVIGVNLLDFGNQSGQIANQARIFKLDPAARARLNTVYMVATFGGGALGSVIGSLAWSAGGWHGVCATGIGLVLLAALALAGWTLFGRKAGRAPSSCV